MMNVIKLRKGLDINLKGKAKEETTRLSRCGEYALLPTDFVGVTPKLSLEEGARVKAGEALFYNKQHPEVKFASPVSGTLSAVIRGERRKILCIKVKADEEQQFVDFGKKDVSRMSGEEIKQHLLDAGLFGFMNQMPYAISALPEEMPKAIFVSAFRDMPLEGKFEYELKGNEKYFQTGLTALSKMAKTYLGISTKQSAATLKEAKDVEITAFDGPCPAGNVNVQINHIDPINKGDVVWTVEPTVVIFFGKLFEEGRVDLTRVVAVGGGEVKNPCYVETLIGTPLSAILDGKLSGLSHIRVINGNPLTGKTTNLDDFLGAHTSSVTVIPEGDDVIEPFGWIMPRTKQFSMSRSYFTWLGGKNREYNLDARLKGGHRHLIMSNEYDKVFPMSIYPEYLVRSLLTGDIDKQEQLGIYEVAPEDFALAEFVDSSKQELQELVRKGLDVLRKENA